MERRHTARRKPLQLVYLEFGRENGGMVKDVSEGGMRFHLMNPVAAGQKLQFAVAIDATRRIEGQAEMVWTDGSGKSGGLSFAELSAASRETLRVWLAEMDGPQGSEAPAPPRAVSTNVAERVPQIAPAVASAIPASVAPQTAAIQAAVPQVVVTPESPETVLEVGSQFISQPVPREVWKRAAREEIAPGERTRRPLSAAKAKAMREEVRVASQATAPAAPETQESRSGSLGAKLLDGKLRVTPPPEEQVEESQPSRRSPEGQAREFRLAGADSAAVPEESADPYRDFLKQPIGGGVPDEQPALEELELSQPTQSGKKGWTAPRLAMVFALAAICGVGAAITAIAYRQTIGESIIRLGEKISGEPRPGNGEPPAATAPGAEPGTPVSPANADKPHAANKRPSEAPSDPGANAVPAPASRQPITQQLEHSGGLGERQVADESVTGQPQLAAGREIVPGKPKRAPEDVASLWVAVENGDTAAEILLANHYAAGEGVERNCEQARVLLQAAIKKGSAAAAKRLAQLGEAGCQ
jgi:hypothetical protein